MYESLRLGAFILTFGNLKVHKRSHRILSLNAYYCIARSRMVNAQPSPSASSVSDEWDNRMSLMTRKAHSNYEKYIHSSISTDWTRQQGDVYSLSRSPVPPPSKSSDVAIHPEQYRSWLNRFVSKPAGQSLSTCMILAMPWAAFIVFGQLSDVDTYLEC